MLRTFFDSNRTVCFWFILILFSIPVTLVLVHDVDIWWHILLGKNYLSNWGPPDFSEWYFTPVNQNVLSLRFTWLGDIFFYLVYLAGGDIGLQLVRILFVLSACYLLFLMGGKKVNGWKLFCLMGVIVGTYQTQLIRNSIFSLMFVPLLFFIWHQYKSRGSKWAIWILPIFLGVWGCIHGSYLLGFGLLALILIGDSLDLIFENAWKSNKKEFKKNNQFKTIGIYFLVIVLSFGLISIKNPKTKKYYSPLFLKRILFIDNSFQDAGVPEKKQEDTTAALQVAKGNQKDLNTNILYWLKAKLNNTLFDTQGAVVSGDFTSPFDNLNKLYVIVAIFFGVLGILSLVVYLRPFKFVYFFPIIAVIFFGYGYLRILGYIPLVVSSILFIAFENKELKVNVPDAVGYYVAIICLALLYLNYASGFKIRIGTGLHAVGFGRMPIYSEKCSDWVFEKYKHENTFTNSGNGGYLLLRWHPEKKVFLDGFYEPHQNHIHYEYLDMLFNQQEPERLLYDKYNVSNAILGLNIGSAIRPFVKSQNWFPVCIDEGQIVFSYRPEGENADSLPEILFDKNDVLGLPYQYRILVSEYCFHIVNSLLLKGHIKDAQLFLTENNSLLEAISEYAPANIVEKVHEKHEKLKKCYGLVNDRALYFDGLHNRAIREKVGDKILEYGFKILQKFPETYHVIYNMAIVFVKQKKFHEAKVYLDELNDSLINNPDFWVKHKEKIAALYRKSFLVEKERKHYNSAFGFLSDSFLLGQGLISEVDVFKEGLYLYADMKKNGKPVEAFSLLKNLHEVLPGFGRILNAMAWHILTEAAPENEDILTAKTYALQSVVLLEEQNDDTLDMAYDTLAEVYFQLGDYEKMKEFEKKAISAAPDNRRANYKARVVRPET